MQILTIGERVYLHSIKISRVISVAGITCLVLGMLLSGRSFGYPGDVFVTAGPVKGPAVQASTGVPSGSYSVSTRTGAAQYSFPIAVPPGRQGVQPSLALMYSSQNPLRGGVAAGWSLNIPSICVDTSSGRLAQTHYKSTLAGGQRLVPVNEPGAESGAETYRAEQDDSYARYEKIPVETPESEQGEHYWRALFPDGTTYFFGERNARDRKGIDSYGTEARWFVSRIVDRFGNQISFHYEAVLGNALNGRVKGIPVDIALTEIEYTINAQANIPAHTRIVFEYHNTSELSTHIGTHHTSDLNSGKPPVAMTPETHNLNSGVTPEVMAPDTDTLLTELNTCPGSSVPIGAQFDYRTGIRLYEGARQLKQIVVLVRDTPFSPFRKRRSINLSYDSDALRCDQLHAPLRLLTSIQEKAWAKVEDINIESPDELLTALPPVTFTYSRLERELSEEKDVPAISLPGVDFTVGKGKRSQDETKAGGWPTIDTMFKDVDGDSQIDILRSRQTGNDEICTFEWKKNLGNGVFSEWQLDNLPTMPWKNTLPLNGSENQAPGSRSGGGNLENCNLAYQFTRRLTPNIPSNNSCGGLAANYTSYKFMDLDGDGDQDLVTAVDYKPGKYRMNKDPALDDSIKFGLAPVCPTQPRCRSKSGDWIPCRTNVGQGLTGIIFFEPGITQGDDTGGICGFEECPNPNDNNCFGGDGNCDCSPNYCGQSPLGGLISSEFQSPDPGQGWSGAPYSGGDVGKELNAPAFAGNQWCQQIPETACPWDKDIGSNLKRGLMYVWRIYWNKHNTLQGLFSQRPDVHLSPIPLESDRAVSSLGSPSSSWHGFVDIDGDGYVDAIWQDANNESSTRFQVFRGDGKGNFLPQANGEPFIWRTPPIRQRARVSLQHSGSITQRKTNHNFHRYTETVVTLQDINGDGLPDYVESRKIGDGQARLRVFFNTGLGFEYYSYIDEMAGWGTILSNDFTTLSRDITVVLAEEPNKQMKYGWSVANRRLVDLDQDGLPDVVQIRPPDSGANNPWGKESRPFASSTTLYQDEVFPFSSDGFIKPDKFNTPGLHHPGETPAVTAYINVGDRFINIGRNAKLQKWRHGLARIQISTKGFGRSKAWKVKTDFIDIDGDGLADLYNNDREVESLCTPGDSGIISSSCGISNKVLIDPEPSQGLRLLETINNGQGGVMTFSYSSGSNREVVVSDPEQGKRNPQSMWVVQTITVDPGTGPESVGTTNYKYHYPVLNQDRQRKFGFRGFEQVTIQHPENAQGDRRVVVERYDYELDFSGRLVNRIVKNNQGTFSSVESIDWQKFNLFGGKVITFHRREDRARICDATNENAESTCRQNGALKRTVYAWAPIFKRIPDSFVVSGSNFMSGTGRTGDRTSDSLDRVGPAVLNGGTSKAGSQVTIPDKTVINPNDLKADGSSTPPPTRDRLCAIPNSDMKVAELGILKPVMIVQCGERLTEFSGAVAKDDRGNYQFYSLINDTDTYHLFNTSTRKFVATAPGSIAEWGAIQTIGAQKTVYDNGNLGLPLETKNWLNPDTVAVTKRCFGPSNGLTSECGKTLTGNITTIQKPNQVATNSSAKTAFTKYGPFKIYVNQTDEMLENKTFTTFTEVDLATGQTTLSKGPFQTGIGMPHERIVYDGLGRIKEKFRTVDAQEGGYFEKHYERIDYFDDEIPVRIRRKQKIEYDGNRAITTDKKFDGLGRLLTQAIETEDGPAVTKFRYDGAGNLIALRVPNPCVPTGSNPCTSLEPDVTFTYQHDSLGRIIKWIPPLDASVTLTYDGLITRSTENPAAGSLPKPVQLTFDVFGRLRAVVEKGSGDIDAVTTYHFDANDNMDQIEDADGIITELDHDFSGRRIEIRRGGRTWIYRYDRNGNMTHEIAPMQENASESDYTNTNIYDDLDRIVEQTPGLRNLTNEQKKRYFSADSVKIEYTYDSPLSRNSVGRLSIVTMPHGKITYQYTAEGWTEKETRNFEINPIGTGSITDERSIEITYNAVGSPVQTIHADDPEIPTITKTDYDIRGLAQGVSVETPQGLKLLAKLNRNLTGLPTFRTSVGQQQLWSYDEHGRVTRHSVKTKEGSIVAGEQLDYNDVGNVRSLKNLGTDVTLNFFYDKQHQLRQTTSMPAEIYDATFEYSQAGRIKAVRIDSSNQSPDVFPRNVQHLYTPGPENTSLLADPAAVRRLMPIGASVSPLATYDYDVSGNLTRRTIGADIWRFVNDGDDQLRESAKCSVQQEDQCAREVYYYAPDGQRMLLVRKDANGNPQQTRQWFGWTEIWYDSTGNVEKTWVHLNLGMPIARIEHLSGQSKTTKFSYSGILKHHLITLDEQGEPVVSFGYGPFGEVLTKTGSTDEHLRRYNGKEFDSFSKLSYYGFRYYDPLSLGWTQTDPLYRFAPDIAYAEPRRMSLYAFSLNNPVRYLDPDGRETVGLIAVDQKKLRPKSVLGIIHGLEAINSAATGEKGVSSNVSVRFVKIEDAFKGVDLKSGVIHILYVPPNISSVALERALDDIDGLDAEGVAITVRKHLDEGRGVAAFESFAIVPLGDSIKELTMHEGGHTRIRKSGTCGKNKDHHCDEGNIMFETVIEGNKFNKKQKREMRKNTKKLRKAAKKKNKKPRQK